MGLGRTDEYIKTRELWDPSGNQDYVALRYVTNERWGWDDQEDMVNNQSIRYTQKKGITEIPFIRRGDSAYVIVEGPTWEAAEANANALGGHLVTINDEEEHEWLLDTYKDYKNLNAPNSTYERIVYIGLNDKIEEGTWKWVSGEESSWSPHLGIWDSR